MPFFFFFFYCTYGGLHSDQLLSVLCNACSSDKFLTFSRDEGPTLRSLVWSMFQQNTHQSMKSIIPTFEICLNCSRETVWNLFQTKYLFKIEYHNCTVQFPNRIHLHSIARMSADDQSCPVEKVHNSSDVILSLRDQFTQVTLRLVIQKRGIISHRCIWDCFMPLSVGLYHTGEHEHKSCRKRLIHAGENKEKKTPGQ